MGSVVLWFLLWVGPMEETVYWSLTMMAIVVGSRSLSLIRKGSVDLTYTAKENIPYLFHSSSEADGYGVDNAHEAC